MIEDQNQIVRTNTSEVLKDTIFALSEGITGIASSKKQEIILSVGHIIQRLRSVGLLDSLREEWNRFRFKGRIAEDYQFTEQHFNCLHELLDFLEKDIPDEIRFTTLKKILLVAAQELNMDRNSLLPHQFMKLCKSMNSGEVLVLLTTYDIAKRREYDVSARYGATRWLEYIADHSGLVFPELVESFETELIKKHLITDRTYGDRSGVNLGKNFRLTNLGVMFCDYVNKYEPID